MPTIIPVASGKGGVGKSLLAANLAIALARRGHTVIAIDLDLGGSNLHSFLGLKNHAPGVGDFLKARSAGLKDLVSPTGIDNLGFVAGDARTPFLANIGDQQKRRLIAKIRELPADYVLLDLSAGTSFNTLDFFRLSRYGLLVTMPEYPAIVNLMTFLRFFFLRTIEKAFFSQPAIRKLLADEYRRPLHRQHASLSDLKTKIYALDLNAGEKTTTLLAQFRPRVVFNRALRAEDFEVSEQMDAAIAESLSVAVDYFGVVFEDPFVAASINARRAHLPFAPESTSAEAVDRIARRIELYWEIPLPDSARRIREELT
jgi:flagellar biosynthesis protein FlhG